MTLIKKWKVCLDQKGYTDAVMMDLSKAFDRNSHGLPITKFQAHDFRKDSLEIILSYLSGCLQCVKVNTTLSSWTELIQGIPQGFVLGSIVFNIYLNDYLFLYFFMLNDTDICNFTDDTTAYVCDVDVESVLEKLEENSKLELTLLEKKTP